MRQPFFSGKSVGNRKIMMIKVAFLLGRTVPYISECKGGVHICRVAYRDLRGLLPKNLQNVAKGGTAPRLVVPTMVCTVTPTVIPPSSAYIAFLHKNKNNSS